ncbi:hypothetical protein A3Q56_07549, partial [Intoshia linei]
RDEFLLVLVPLSKQGSILKAANEDFGGIHVGSMIADVIKYVDNCDQCHCAKDGTFSRDYNIIKWQFNGTREKIIPNSKYKLQYIKRQSIYFISKEWDEVKIETIQNCWIKIEEHRIEVNNEYEESQIEETIEIIIENFHRYENMEFYDGPDVAPTDSTETFKILNKLEENIGQVCPKSLKAFYDVQRIDFKIKKLFNEYRVVNITSHTERGLKFIENLDNLFECAKSDSSNAIIEDLQFLEVQTQTTSYDTTASNTGKIRGSVHYLKQFLTTKSHIGSMSLSHILNYF